MKSSDLQQGRTYNFDVVKESSSKKFYKIKLEDGVEFSLSKFKFQYDSPIPDQIQCYVKSLYPLTLSQDLSVFINKFYQEGKEYGFIVKGVKNDPELQYEIEDEYGLYFKLNNTPIQLNKGNKIKCKILRIRDANVTLKYVGSLSQRYNLDFKSVKQWAELIGSHEDYSNLEKSLMTLPEFALANQKHDNEQADWILELIKNCGTNMPEWLTECRSNLPLLRLISRRLRIIKKIALYIIEESDYLRSCNIEQRNTLRDQLSNYIEIFDQYIQAGKIILENRHNAFINKLFEHLKESGYLYKPSRQIRILMTILKLRPELINSQMGELFEALHNWDPTNWLSEPFRSALVEQLQIFIEENYRKVNQLPVGDASIDNKVINTMILAIAIQRLLAFENDNISLDLNRAMLYRYTSYLLPDDVDNLLDNAWYALLGYDYPNEFTWNDTINPILLFHKVSMSAADLRSDSTVTKTYSSSKVDIQLQNKGLNIIAKGSDPEKTVVPNNLFEWRDISISLNDQINLHFNKKSKDIKIYRQLWDEIIWSIFGGDEKEIIYHEKTEPEEGDEVRVIIDDVRIAENAPERQKLQFHCTIKDELYHGEGWLPSDTLHFLGWLSRKDIPINFDGTTNFAKDNNGNFLHFMATVSQIKDGELIFSMKSQIEDYLYETSYPGQESIAIVTNLDRNNNSWICLSENGASFKLACDDQTVDLSEGAIIRITYIEPDRSNNHSQYFIGELSTNQEDLPLIFKKSDSLVNLMQKLGEEDEREDNNLVLEIDEVLSREELIELIHLLLRKSYAEDEYVKAFNYLGLSLVLSKIVEEQKLQNEIKMHMDLLEFLHDFGRNRKVELEELAPYAEKVAKLPMLERLFTRLKIVSYLNQNDKGNWLWNLRQNPRNETEANLASLVLSYNMLPSEMDGSRKQIMNQIATLLNVNSTVPTSKYYGDESQTVEFKSSLIYSTHGGNKPAPKEQLFEIAHTICGFMNARGGNLYIGVNDSGYENGLDDDLEFRRIHGEKPTIDGLIIYLQNYLDRVLPSHSKDHWKISSDKDSKKGVIIVEILPVKEPVELDGVIYVRSSSSTKPRLNEERELFIKNRPHNYEVQMKMWGIDKLEDEEAEEIELEVNKKETTKEPQELEIFIRNEDINDFSDNSSSENNKIDGIVTGMCRRNVLHDYEMNFVEPSIYLYFQEDDSIMISYEDIYYDLDPKCRLALALNHKEKEGYLVLCNKKNNLLKIELQDIINSSNQIFRIAEIKDKLKIVNPANEDDYLLSIIKASSGNIFYRLDNIKNLPDSQNLKYQYFTLIDNQHEILLQDIVNKSKLSLFDKEAIDRDSKFYGISLPDVDGMLSIEEKIESLIRPIKNDD